MTVPVPTILARQLSQVVVGASITIVHRGLKASRTGDRKFRDFEVLIESTDRLPESREAPPPEAPSEADSVGAEDTPF